MKGARSVVAINKDSEAPIFEIADYAVVGNLFDIVPPLIEEIKKGERVGLQSSGLQTEFTVPSPVIQPLCERRSPLSPSSRNPGGWQCREVCGSRDNGTSRCR